MERVGNTLAASVGKLQKGPAVVTAHDSAPPLSQSPMRPLEVLCKAAVCGAVDKERVLGGVVINTTLIMPHNYKAEACQKFVVPNPPSKDNYSPGGHVTGMEEWEGEQEIMLS